jgi:hypothetical protein
MAASKKKSAKKSGAAKAPATKAAKSPSTKAAKKSAKKSAVVKKSPAKLTKAQKRLQLLVGAVSKVPAKDKDAFCDNFFVALSERISELDAAEEYVLYYLGTELLEREVANGGFAQAFINLGLDSQFVTWAQQGYRALKKPKAAAVLATAIKLARKDSAKLAQIAKAAGTKRGIDAYIAYRQLGTFSKVEDAAEKDLFFTSSARIALIKKYREHFATL